LLAGIDACEGDLRTTAAEIPLEPAAGPMPAPMGGVIADGIYDLIAQREYESNSLAEVYLRAAIRFSEGGTQAEQTYDPSLAYFADSETPHRLMTVTPEGAVLHFEVTCPDTAIFPSFDRGFTVEGSELWLFQGELVEVYVRRP
jgi:hypothetical protein